MQSGIGILPVRLAVTRWTRRGQAGSLCYIARELSLGSKWVAGVGECVGGSLYWSNGVWGIRPLFDGYLPGGLHEAKLMTFCKRPHPDPPTRRYVSPAAAR
jgi:hypothetical protein